MADISNKLLIEERSHRDGMPSARREVADLLLAANDEIERLRAAQKADTERLHDAILEITRLRAAIDTSIGDLLHEDSDNAYVVLVGSRQPLPSPPTQSIE